MSSVLLFVGRSLLDKPGIRESYLRIPEVSATIKQAQKFLDFTAPEKYNLMSYVLSDDKDFHGQTHLKNLVVQLIQIGLYKRMQKSLIKPKFIIGPSDELSAINVCLGKININDLLLTFLSNVEEQTLKDTSADILIGQKLELCKIFAWNGETYIDGLEGKSSLSLLDEVAKDNLINQIISLGVSDLEFTDSSIFYVMNSLALDPLLNWLQNTQRTA